MTFSSSLAQRGWKECKLGDVVEIIGGGTPKTSIPEYWNGNIPWLSVVDFNTGNKYVYKTEKTITQKGLEGSSTALLNEGDIIISARGTVGALAVIKKQMAFNQSCYGIRGISGVSNQDYVYYLIKDSINNLQQIAHGGVFDTITRETFDHITINLPSLPEQRAIAGVLSSLDDKIDLLHRQNKTLEGIAEAIFRKIFIDNSLGWEGCPISDLATHEKISVHPKENPDVIFEHYSIPAYDESCVPRKELGSTIQSNKYQVFKNSILFSKLNPHKDKRIWFIPDTISGSAICSTEFQVMLPKDDNFFYFLYEFISFSGNYNEIAAGIGGTSGSHQRIDPEVIFNFPCFIPSANSLVNYNNTVKPIFNKIHLNRKTISTLVKQREVLLPKLMHGEVRVKNG